MTRRRWTLSLVALLGVALALGAVWWATSAEDGVDVHQAPQASPPPVDAELADAGWPEAAAWVRREVEDDRPVVMNVLASWCLPCERELPVLLDARERNPDIAFVGIDHLDQREAAAEFLEDNEVTFPTLYDPAGDIAGAIGARGMPTTAFFDRDGRMVARHTGELTEQTLDEYLAQIE